MHEVLRSSAEDDRRVEERSESLAVLYVNADDGEKEGEKDKRRISVRRRETTTGGRPTDRPSERSKVVKVRSVSAIYRRWIRGEGEDNAPLYLVQIIIVAMVMKRKASHVRLRRCVVVVVDDDDVVMKFLAGINCIPAGSHNESAMRRWSFHLHLLYLRNVQ